MTYKLSSLIMLLLIVAGCASKTTFNRDVLRENLSHREAVSDEDIQKTLSLKPQLPRPFKIGVYFKDPEFRISNDADWSWRWTSEDKQKILSVADELKKSGEVSGIFIINPAMVNGHDLKSLRMAAAQHGADALLIVSGVSDHYRQNTAWAWTYIALVTAFFVPATETNALFISRAALWDVRNQFLYMTAEAESEKRVKSPAFILNDRKLLKSAKEDSINSLRSEVMRMASGMSKKK